MAHELPAKLRVTMALLGCDSRKELCARFREVNPRTQFDLERSHKWLQGRAKPRTAQVYEDWARLLGLQRPAAWLTACTLDAFLDEACSLFAADRQDLRRRAGLLDRPPPAAGGAAEGATVHYLCGAYVAYCNSWSPYFPGQLSRSSVVVHPGKGTRFPVEYRLSPPAGPVEFKGQLGVVGRVLHMELRDAGSGAPIYVTAFLPGRPASVLCGIMSGATVNSPDPEPSATRIALVRVPPAPAAEPGGPHFFPASAGALAADLAARGVAPVELDAAAAGLLAFLNGRDRPGMNQVRPADQARLARLFDRAAAPVAPTGAQSALPSMASRTKAGRVGSSATH